MWMVGLLRSTEGRKQRSVARQARQGKAKHDKGRKFDLALRHITSSSSCIDLGMQKLTVHVIILLLLLLLLQRLPLITLIVCPPSPPLVSFTMRTRQVPFRL